MLVNGVLSLSISLHDLETTMNASRGSLRLMRTRHVTRAPVCCCCQLVFVQFTLDTLAKWRHDSRLRRRRSRSAKRLNYRPNTSTESDQNAVSETRF